MAWRRPGAKPLSVPMIVNALMYIGITRPQRAKHSRSISNTELDLTISLIYIINHAYNPLFKQMEGTIV